ncbi:MAG: hypothetical protein Q8O67_20500 [Deltaproteobacteria bacterium]|nr:hypothetical protein [Deltaproteobacteria bacterium]
MLALFVFLAAMTVPPMTEAELRAQADVVVDGTVVAQHSAWVGRRVITFSTVVVGSGAAVRSYLVALPGGDVGAFSQRVPGSPVLAIGGRYRLYLGKADGPVDAPSTVKSRGVVGFFRGVFLVDPSAGRNGALVPFGDDGLPVVVR